MSYIEFLSTKPEGNTTSNTKKGEMHYERKL